MLNGVRVWTIKDNYRLGDNIQPKVLAFAFALSVEIERDLISQRTKEALTRRRSEGVILGRPIGRKSSRVKLSGHEKEIQMLIDKRTSKSAIGRIFGVNRMTVDSFLKERMKL
jgi:DNA invertase Pin-like site-specific DNA recombinase